jgi:Fic family protein
LQLGQLNAYNGFIGTKYVPILSFGGSVTIKKKAEIEALILKLLEEKTEIGLHDVAQAAGLTKSDETDRKTIQRAFTALIKRGVLEVKGAARARVYLFKPGKTSGAEAEAIEASTFKDIPLSTASEKLLRYLSKSIQGRAPVGYNQDFLKSYEPNRSEYLSAAERAELLTAGRVENAVRPAGTYARNILNRLLIDLSWNSSRLEGNTYSLLETKRLIELGENAQGKDASEAQMILNHKGAIEYIIESAAESEISSHGICSIHALLSENLLGDPSASGRVRQIAVGVAGTTYLPLENPHVLRECFDIFIQKMNLIEDPFEQSFFSLVHLSYMQAFEDVNKRTARLVANIPLIKKNLKPLSFTDVNKEAYVQSLLGIYEKNDISLFKDLYLWAYKRSSQRYSAIQQAMGEPNLLKLKYRNLIQEIVRTLILEKIDGSQVVHQIQNLIEAQGLPEADATQLFQVIETEILSLHDGNIARFKIRPSEFQEWKSLQ